MCEYVRVDSRAWYEGGVRADAAYLSRDAWNVLQPTAWVPLVPATTVNGCMQVIPGGHRSGKVATHTACAGNTWYIDLAPAAMAEELGALAANAVTVEVPLGSVLFLNNLIPHRSMENRSQGTRWSLDLRWQRPWEPNGFDSLNVTANRLLVRCSPPRTCMRTRTQPLKHEANLACRAVFA